LGQGPLGRLLPFRQTQLGASRFGGLPDLPTDLVWPATDGSLLLFVAQLNLEEVPPDACLPRHGWLFFFLGSDKVGWNVDHKVLYWDGSRELLVRRNLPQAPFVETEYRHPFRPAALRFSPAVTLPPLFKYPDLDEHYDALLALRNRLVGDPDCTKVQSRLLRHPTDYGGDSAAEAYVVSQGRPELIHHLHANAGEQLDKEIIKWQAAGEHAVVAELNQLKAMMPWYHDDFARHEPEIANWQLLLEVNSHQACGMQWWDMGVLQFLIDSRDLAAAGFSRTYACIESG
jgi:uncharacterized protein YwqG